MKHLSTLAIAMVMALGANAQNTRFLTTNTNALDVAAIEAQTPTTLTRILFAGYNSICLPMTLDAEQLQAAAPGVQVERMAAIRQEGATLTLCFVDCTAEGIEAGVPYLIYSPKTQYMRAQTRNAVATSTTLRPVTLSDANGNRVTFSSAWEAVSGGNRYGIPAQQDTDELQSILIFTEPEKTFLPTRCGFTWEKQAPTATTLEVRHALSLDATVTAIDDLRATDAKVDVYDVSGALIRSQVSVNEAYATLPRGIYVIGGQKVAIK
ncbi:MAG: T9SS type A sorting domain-containing protein [Bacteroidaceae bacterium]|nr:T9SS type A sorting domain-containing protein [Bacteroidaceae bacterium]